MDGLMGYITKQGAFPQVNLMFFKGKQRGMAENPPKDG